MLILDGHGSHTHIDFMWECRVNQVEIIYLPAHSSHVLQPLDLGVFAPLKSRYRKEIVDLACLGDASPVKKRRFIQAYQKARAATFNNERTLRAGWSAAGIFPWNPDKTLNFSQVHRTTRPPSPPPSPPPHPSTPERSTGTNEHFRTPEHPRDILEFTQRLGKLTRDQRMAFQKASKALGNITTIAAKLQAEKRSLEMSVEELESKRKMKKLTVDLNSQFANVENIKRAIEEAKAAEARAARRQPEEELKRVSRKLEQSNMESCMFEWQLDM